MSKRNRYSKALKHLKSTQIEEKIKCLDEALPTNHTKGLYSLNATGYQLGDPPPQEVFYPDQDGNWSSGVPGVEGESSYTRAPGFWTGGSNWDTTYVANMGQDEIGEDGKNTAGLIAADGTVKTSLPENSRSFILGPLVDGFTLDHTSDAYTNIGYLQKDTRQFVLLGRIEGQWKADLEHESVAVWDGTATGFTSYNENFTLAMAQWFRDRILAKDYASNVPYFYSGGVPQGDNDDCPNCPDGMKGGNGVGGGGGGQSSSGVGGGGGWGSGGDPDEGTPGQPGGPNEGDAEDAGYPSWGPMGGLGDGIKDFIDNIFGPGTSDGIGDLIDGLTGGGGDGDDDGGIGDFIGGVTDAFGDGIAGALAGAIGSMTGGTGTGDSGGTGTGTGTGTSGTGTGDSGGTGAGDSGGTGAGSGGYGGSAPPPPPSEPETKKDTTKQPETKKDTTKEPPSEKEQVPFQPGQGLGKTLNDIKKFFGDKVAPPAAEYSTNIAKSILQNKPIVVKQSDVPQGDIDKLLNNLDVKIIDGINDTPIPYADENFYIDKNGNVQSNIGPNGEKEYYKKDQTGYVHDAVNKPITNIYQNPLASAGQAQVQVVSPPNGEEPYLIYTDHAYHNLDSEDRGEVPDPIKAGLSSLVHQVAGHGKDTIKPGTKGQSSTGEIDATTPNTGAMSGYPPGIRGDVKTEIKIPYSKLPKKIRDKIDFEKNYQEITGKTKIKESFSCGRLRKVKFVTESTIDAKIDKVREKLKNKNKTSLSSKALKPIAYSIAGEIVAKKGPEVAKKVADGLKDYASEKIKTKDQIVELVIDEFNRLRLDEGMTSKGFEYLYGVAVSNVVSQYGIDSKFASDLLHASADTTDYEFGPDFPGSYINSIGDHQVDSSRRVNINAYYDSTYGSSSGFGNDYTMKTLSGSGAATIGNLESALGITFPDGIPNGKLHGTPKEGSAVERVFTKAEPGNIINFSWAFASSELGIPKSAQVDDYAFVSISGNTSKIVSILRDGNTRNGIFRYKLKSGDIDGNGNVRVAVGVVDVYDKLYNSTFKISNFGSLYAGDVGSAGDTTDGIDLGTSVDNLDPNKKKIAMNDNLYNWMHKTYGLPAAEWKQKNPTKPDNSNPFLPKGSYVPKAKGGNNDIQIAAAYPPPQGPLQQGPSGYKKPGTYDPNKFYNLAPGSLPSPNIPYIGPGRSNVPGNKDTQIANMLGPNTPLPAPGWQKKTDFTPKPMWQKPKPGGGSGKWGTNIKLAKNGKKKNKNVQVAHYEPQGRVITESSFTPRQIKILREIKKPIEIKEAPKKYKMNFAGKYSSQNTPDKTASAISDGLVASGNAKGQKWRVEDNYWSGYETTEKMNIIYDRVGHGQQAWDKIIAEASRKNGWRTREMQEQLNIRAHEKAMLKENPDYQSPWGIQIIETTDENVKNFDRADKIKQVLSKDLKGYNRTHKKKDIAPEYPDEAPPEIINKTIDAHYEPQGNPLMEKENLEPKEHKSSGKGMKSFQQFFNPADIKPEYPDEAPPEMVNGYHPKLVDDQQISNRFNKLDPQSAKAMPKTGNPHIDAKVEKAKNNPDKDGPAYRQGVFDKIKKARG